MEAGPCVYLVDDDESVLTALGRLLRSHGRHSRSFTNGRAFLEDHDAAIPGCAVIDLNLPGLDGLEVQKALAEVAPARPIVFLTGYGTVDNGVRAMKAGAIDFLQKPVAPSAFLAAVSSAIDVDARNRAAAMKRLVFEHRRAMLTTREAEVLDQVVAGRLNKQIAADLGIVEKTVKVHRSRMLAKMEVRSVAELVREVTLFGG